MPNQPPTERMPVEQSLLLSDFARTCRAAARAVSLYPGAHPAIDSSLARLLPSVGRLTGHGPVTLAVYRDLLAIDRRSPIRPDPAIGELAALLHERLIGLLVIEPDADAEDWRAFLRLLARSPEDLLAEGGIAHAWRRTGRAHLGIGEIDYAEALRERGGTDRADWDRILTYCLRSETGPLDARAVGALTESLSAPDQFARLVDELQQARAPQDAGISVTLAAWFQLMRTAVDAARPQGEAAVDRALQTIAASCSRLTPGLMLAMLERRTANAGEDAALATMIAGRMTEADIASFLARSVVAERGATERLSQAFAALAPAPDRRKRIIQLAQREARILDPGSDAFDQPWEQVANAMMAHSLASHSDEAFVPAAYGRELAAAPAQAIEVERVSDDPPERIQTWLSSVSDIALHQLDLALLLDLLRIETVPVRWEPIAGIAASEVERRTLAGDFAGASTLVEALAREAGTEGRPGLRAAAATLVERLTRGPLARHVALHFGTIADADVQRLNQLCEMLGPGMAPSLADALAREEHATSIRRLGALLLRFGSAGRRSVEQLKNSPNASIRRTAVSLLRGVAGHEALLELAAMIGDADPEVQREAIHAIVDLGTANAYSVLHRLLLEADTPRETALRELLALRDDKAVPLFSYVLTRSEPRGRRVAIHVSIIEALGAMSPRPESIRALQLVLLRGGWWTPFRTWTMRQAAAAALRRLGTPEALTTLEAAASRGSRSVRKLARAQLALFPRREKTGA